MVIRLERDQASGKATREKMRDDAKRKAAKRAPRAGQSGLRKAENE